MDYVEYSSAKLSSMHLTEACFSYRYVTKACSLQEGVAFYLQGHQQYYYLVPLKYDRSGVSSMMGANTEVLTDSVESRLYLPGTHNDPSTKIYSGS